MRATTLARLAIAGNRTDSARIGLTALGAALGCLALLAAATVLAIPGIDTGDGAPMAPYTNGLLREPGLRPGVAFALILLTIPVLSFVAQCARLGAPGRDRRLAAIRLAGATPRQTLTIAAAESAAATLAGSVLALAVYLIGRRLLDRPDLRGERPLPTDVLPPWWALATICLGLPVIAALLAALLLRRVTVTPLGVIRRVRTGRPRPWPGVLIALGVAAFVAINPLLRYFSHPGRISPAYLIPLLLFGGGLLAAAGVVAGTGWIAHTAGGLLGRFAHRPAALLASRRLLADPWSGSRAFAAMLVAALFGGGAAWLTEVFRASLAATAESQRLFDQHLGQDSGISSAADFYTRSMELVGYAILVATVIAAAGLAIALADVILSRRRSYAALVTTGVPRSVLARAITWQTLVVIVPATVLAMGTGLLMARAFSGGTVVIRGTGITTCVPPADQPEVCGGDWASQEPYLVTWRGPDVARTVHFPWRDVTLFGCGVLVAVLLVVGLGLLFLRASTSVDELRTT